MSFTEAAANLAHSTEGRGPGKVEEGEGKRKTLKENNVQLEPPLCEKATQNRSKTFKVL